MKELLSVLALGLLDELSVRAVNLLAGWGPPCLCAAHGLALAVQSSERVILARASTVEKAVALEASFKAVLVVVTCGLQTVQGLEMMR